MNQINTNHSRHSLTILGSEQSGKTCFLAGLGILSEGDRPSDIMLSSEGESKKMIRDLSAIFRAQEWPAGTTMEHNFIGTLRYKRRNIKLHMVEYAGEQFREGFSGGREKPQNLLNALNNSQFLLLALDPHVELARDEIMASSNEDRDRYHARLDSLLEALVQKQRERDGKEPFQVGLLINKADLIEEDLSTPEQAEAYVQKTAPNFYQKLSREFKDLRTFAVSAVGRTERDENGRMIPAKDLEPWGYEYVFDWVLGEIKRKKRNTRIFRSFLGLLLMGLLWMAFSETQNLWNSRIVDRWDQMVRRGIDANNSDEAERLARKLDAEHYKERVDQILEKSQQQQSSSSTKWEEASNTLYALRALAATKNPYRLPDLQSDITDLSNTLEKTQYQILKIAYEQNNPEFTTLAQQFLKNFPNSDLKNDVNQWLEEKISSEFAETVNRIYKQSAGDLTAVQEKVDMIHEFIYQKFPNTPRRADIEEASKLAIKLIKETEQGIDIDLLSVGKLINDGYLKMKIFLGRSDNPAIDVESPDKVTEFSFENDKRHRIPWELGQDIDIELFRYGGIYGFRDYKQVARIKLRWIFAVLLLEGYTELEGVEGGEANFINNKAVFKCDVIGWKDDDRILLEDWIAPGNAWKELIPHE